MIAQPYEKVVAKGKKQTKICAPEIIKTPTGPEVVLQKAELEKLVKRDETGETIVKNLAVSDVDNEGVTLKNTLNIQQL